MNTINEQMLNFLKLPHTAITITGCLRSGKSVLMQNLILGTRQDKSLLIDIDTCFYAGLISDFPNVKDYLDYQSIYEPIVPYLPQYKNIYIHAPLKSVSQHVVTEWNFEHLIHPDIQKLLNIIDQTNNKHVKHYVYVTTYDINTWQMPKGN